MLVIDPIIKDSSMHTFHVFISFDLVIFISIILSHSPLLFGDVCQVSNHLVQLTANWHSDLNPVNN